MRKTDAMKSFARVWFGLALLAAVAAAGCSRIAPGSWPGVGVDDETVWVAYQQQVHAVARNTGALRWSFPQEPERNRLFFAPPRLTADGQRLIVGGYDKVLYALDPNTGAVQWTFDRAQDRYIGAVLVTPNAIYAPNADGTLYALEPNGQLRWTFTTQAALWAPPATDGQRLYLASMDHHLYALDAATGKELWRLKMEGALTSTPTLLDGVLYVGELATQVAAVDAAQGQVLWQTPTDAWVWHSPTPLGDDALVVGDMEGQVYALARGDGQVRWQTEVPGGVIGAPAVVEDTVFVTTRQGQLVALDAASGAVKWTKALAEAAIEAGPLPVPELGLLVAPSDPKAPLLAVRSDGALVWSLTFEK